MATGRVLIAAPFQDKGMVRFSNEMFKIYVRLRKSIYVGVDAEVNYAWTAARSMVLDGAELNAGKGDGFVLPA